MNVGQVFICPACGRSFEPEEQLLMAARRADEAGYEE